jgi:hypothetical protein
LKHFAALDTVILPKMHVHVINRDGPAADGEAFARSIPPQRDWAFECFVHNLMPELIGYYTLSLTRDWQVVSPASKALSARVA